MPFREILGQDRVVSLLRRTWRSGRLGQAYCFSGPAGVGKRTTALALAQAVNCLAPVDLAGGEGEPDACGVCRSCRKIAAGQHPDVAVVTPEDKTVISIEQIRDLTARASLCAYEGTTKVWILDPADQMQEPAANAFLKTLEEPSGRSLFLLVTPAVNVLLPTIRSRCQEVRFDLLGEAALRAILVRQGRGPDEAAAAAALAGGSAERALTLDPAEASAARETLIAEWREALGSLPRLLDFGERYANDRARLETDLDALQEVVRDLALVAAGGEAADLLPPERRAAVSGWAGAVTLEVALRLHETVTEARWAMLRKGQPRLVADRMLLRMRDAISKRRQDGHDADRAR